MFHLRRLPRSLFLSVALTLPIAVLAQGNDIEPNNPCPVAQDLGLVLLPFTVDGYLDSPLGGAADIDFFRVTGEPGDFLRADLKGASSGVGDLPDPLIGLFDADCNLIDLNDDAGSSDSRLLFHVPDNGVFVLAATAFPDFGFNGGGQGSYQLTIDQLQIAESVSGRLVNARDGTPLPGDFPTGSYAQLFRCANEFCFEYVNFQSADINGNFRFESDFNGNPLLAGGYQIQAYANGFEFLTTERFELAASQALGLGDIALTPFRLIGSVSGRLVDAIDGSPLSGAGPPFATAILERCDDFGCFGVAVGQANDQGFFEIIGIQTFIPPDTYRLTVIADDYRRTTTEPFTVDEFEHLDLGDVPVTPTALQFGEIQVCAIPPGGGLCEYSIEVQNRGPGRFRGMAWSIVDYFPNAAPYRASRFQVGKVGTMNPMPERLNLRAGQSTTLHFQLYVPGSIPDFSTLCAVANVGENINAQFNNSGDRFLFCVVINSGQFSALPEKQGRKRLRELKRQAAQ